MAKAVEKRTWKWDWNPLYLESCSAFLSMAEAVEKKIWKWDWNPLYPDSCITFFNGRGCEGEELEVGLKSLNLESCSTFLSMAEAVEKRRTWKWDWNPLYLESCSAFLSMAVAVEKRNWK
jgi:hypothetical protein